MKALKELFVFAAVLVVLAGAWACQPYVNGDNLGADSGDERGENQVWLRNLEFNPQTLNVTVGTTVTWINKDVVNHRIVSGTPNDPTERFDSGNLGNAETFSFTFTSAGTFSYFCKLHPTQMTGSIVVQ